MDRLILELKELDKKYPSGVHAVKKINFTFERGEIHALLGPNGAGKSTTLGMICTLVKPSSGDIYFNGIKVLPGSTDYHSRIGVVSQHANLEMDLNAYQNLKVHAFLYNMKKKEREERIAFLLKLAGLSESKERKVRYYSGGMKRKLQIIRALLHKPELLILDEPTVGLDPAGREKIWDMILMLNREGMSILFSTHYMEEAQQYAEKVSIIHHGEIIRSGNVDSLIDSFGRWCRVELRPEGRKTLFFDSREDAIEKPDSKDSQLIIRETTLEDIFISLTGKDFS